MVNTSEELRAIAIAIVEESQPCRPEELVSRLRSEFGVSQSEAHRTVLELIRDRRLQRTFFGELVVPGAQNGSAGGGYPALLKVVGVVLLLAIVVFMAWVFYNLVADDNAASSIAAEEPADRRGAPLPSVVPSLNEQVSPTFARRRETWR